MAFYFALFNVSSVNQELRGHRKAQKKERRRHSLATSSHVAKDYRLLPKPKIILHDTNTDNETVSTLLDESTGDETSEHNSFTYLSTEDPLKYRRASSPESRHAMDIAFNEPFLLNDVERRLKRVKFNSPTTTHNERSNNATASNWSANSVDEQVWVKRTVSPPKSDDQPWVYSIDLEKKKQTEKASNRSSFPDRQRPTMGVAALELRSENGQKSDKLKDDLRRHINTWPDIRTNRSRWRPTLLLRRHSGGNLTDNERLVGIFQKRKSNGSQIPYQSIQSPLSSPQEPQQSGSTERESRPIDSKTTAQLPPKPTKAKSIVIVPTGKPSSPSTSNSLSTNINSWAQLYRSRPNESNVPFVRLDNNVDGVSNSKNMIRSSVF